MNPVQNRVVLVGGGDATMTVSQLKEYMGPAQYTKNYYVDGNVSATGSGDSWDSPFSTLAEALAASHAAIAVTADRHWARRNAIWCCGDNLVEDLTALAQKTDIIGTGSADHNYSCKVVGNHAIGATNYMGCRFINMHFAPPAAGGDIFTIPTTLSGFGVFGCTFDAYQATPAGGAIIATASHQMAIDGCVFKGAFSDAVIEIGAGACNGLIIRNNIIQGGQVGIEINSGATLTLTQAGWIIDNTIYAATLCIDDNSDLFHVVGNRCISAAACGGAAAPGAMDANVALSVGNYVVTSDSNAFWPVAVAAA